MIPSLSARSRASVSAWIATILVAAFIVVPAGISQVTVTEGFESGSNEGGWAWGTGNETFVPVEGNPGAYLSDETLYSYLPVLGTAWGSPCEFTGNYRERGVTSVGVDLRTWNKQLAVEPNRFLTLFLINDNDTPWNLEDDRGAYFVGDTVVPDSDGGVPMDTPSGWTPFDFEVDSQASSTPPGWEMFNWATGPNPKWADLMADVDTVQFWSGTPGTYYLLDSWDVGADNARITTANSCQDDLGFAGPGNLSLSVCGEALASGGTATLSIDGTPSKATAAWIVLGLSYDPTPLFDGVLVPVPVLNALPVTVTGGRLDLTVAGGGGPLTAYVQVLAQGPGGWEFSNALAVDLLP
ncbi:MAG: hypothetical protein ACYTG2_13965 [Planctomycetota bacterium]|jgi:hypothetical protein